MKKRRIDIITLGCSKNLVDSEQLIRQLEEVGYSVTHDTENPQGEIAVINTCGFIGDAKEESINMILEFAERKEEGPGRFFESGRAAKVGTKKRRSERMKNKILPDTYLSRCATLFSTVPVRI